MPFDTGVKNVIIRIGTEYKALRALIGSLTSLTTTEKGTIVGALNEVRSQVGNSGAQINDSSASGTTVYSSNQTEARINAAVAALVDSAPGTLDTLNELAAALGDDPNAVATLTTELGNRVRFDAAQTLTTGQATQARSNIGAVGTTDLGDPNTDFVAVFNAAIA